MPLLDVAVAVDEIEHPHVIGQDPGAESPEPPRGSRREEGVEEDRAEASILPGIEDDEGHFGSAVMRRFVARHPE